MIHGGAARPRRGDVRRWPRGSWVAGEPPSRCQPEPAAEGDSTRLGRTVSRAWVPSPSPLSPLFFLIFNFGSERRTRSCPSRQVPPARSGGVKVHTSHIVAHRRLGAWSGGPGVARAGSAGHASPRSRCHPRPSQTLTAVAPKTVSHRQARGTPAPDPAAPHVGCILPTLHPGPPFVPPCALSGKARS